jgi:hypothetical protein
VDESPPRGTAKDYGYTIRRRDRVPNQLSRNILSSWRYHTIVFTESKERTLGRHQRDSISRRTGVKKTIAVRLLGIREHRETGGSIHITHRGNKRITTK